MVSLSVTLLAAASLLVKLAQAQAPDFFAIYNSLSPVQRNQLMASVMALPPVCQQAGMTSYDSCSQALSVAMQLNVSGMTDAQLQSYVRETGLDPRCCSALAAATRAKCDQNPAYRNLISIVGSTQGGATFARLYTALEKVVPDVCKFAAA